MLLEELSFAEVEAYLEQKDSLLIPVGAVEQHSPYGLIGTDFIAAEAVARGAARELAIMVAPTLCYGISPQHLDFAGSASLQPTTLIALGCDLLRSFVRHGFRRIFFVNGHGGNRHALGVVLQQVKMEGLPGIFEIFSWYECSGVKRFNLRDFAGKEGRHATPSEVSLTMHLRPTAFAGKAREPLEVEHPERSWPMSAAEMRRSYPDGRMESAPWLAHPEIGEQILAEAVTDLVRKVERFLEMPLISPG
ncbi:creatininase family protein [Desulfogranum mediterraneum]|uniref:creatininase family protein n=1 Tax=Desulfogranum mediterraneum TaxID=160661 RepID=UPI0003FC778E|nr:creatininase family protein [Desulfogranum mediterraneum]